VATRILLKLQRREIIRQAQKGRDTPPAANCYVATEHTIKLASTFAASSGFDNGESSRAHSLPPDESATTSQ